MADTRARVLNVRLSYVEWGTLIGEAEQAGLSWSAWMRAAIAEKARRDDQVRVHQARELAAEQARAERVALMHRNQGRGV